MYTNDYLLKFRKCHLLESVERLCDKLDKELSGTELLAMHRAADHRRAELSVKKNFDIGAIPKAVWSYVK